MKTDHLGSIGNFSSNLKCIITYTLFLRQIPTTLFVGLKKNTFLPTVTWDLPAYSSYLALGPSGAKVLQYNLILTKKDTN